MSGSRGAGFDRIDSQYQDPGLINDGFKKKIYEVRRRCCDW